MSDRDPGCPVPAIKQMVQRLIMKSTMLFLTSVVLCSVSFGVNPAFAQGTAFTYQGILNVAGNPANGDFDMTFSLFNADRGDSRVGSTITSPPC